MSDSSLPLTLCDEAAALVRRRPTSSAYRRGAAFIARQAIESAVRSGLGPAERPKLTWRSRFLILPVAAPHVDARRGLYLWSVWSGICHYQMFEIVPDDKAILQRIADTRAWIATVR